MTSCSSTGSYGATLLPQVALRGPSVASFAQLELCVMNSNLASATPSAFEHKTKVQLPPQSILIKQINYGAACKYAH